MRDVSTLMEMTVSGRDTEQYHHHLGLGLGLSLGMAGSTTSPVEPAAPLRSPTRKQQRWNGAGLFFPSSSGEQRTHADDQRLAALARHEMPFLRGIDVNRAPVVRGSCGPSEDEEPGASSPDSTLSSLSGKRGAPARSGGGGEQGRAGAGSDDEDDSVAAGGASRKKLRLSKDQSAVLEERFKEHSTLNPKQKAALARQLGLRPRQVEVWFQNRRARTKLKQTEVDCESLKRCCETLTDENRRLQQEVQELRALKLLAPPPPPAHHLLLRALPPTTLTMCPSRERVAPSGKPAVAESRAATLVTRLPPPTGPWGPVPMMPVFVGRPAQRS